MRNALDRGLWDAAYQSDGRPIVGVVGAAHVKGITQAWPTIGGDESLAKLREMFSPKVDQRSQMQTGTLLGGKILTGVLLHSQEKRS
jgi:pheromone shutdown protein TraB